MRMPHVLAIAALGLLVAGCSRNNIEAVNLAIEGDKAKSNNLDEAISKYEQATQLDPTNHRILYKLTLAYRKKEDWAKAASTAGKAAKLAPTYASYSFEQGLALARQAGAGAGSWADAKAPLEEAIQKDANIADAHFELAEVLLNLDDEQSALRAYSKAIETKPDNLSYYTSLADLYLRLDYRDAAEATLKEGLSFGQDGDKFLFHLHSLMGSIQEQKGDTSGAVREYEAAKKACGPCNEAGQQIAFFNLGAAYAQMSPPKKSEAMQQIGSFQKMVCKGAAAKRYEDQCAYAQQIATKLGAPLQ